MKSLALVSIVMAWPGQSATPEGFPLASGTYTFRMVDWEFSHGDDLYIYGKASVIVRDSHIKVVYLENDHAYAKGGIIDEGLLAWSGTLNGWMIKHDNSGEDDCPTKIDPERRLVFTC